MRIPKYRIKVLYHGPYVRYAPQVKRWFGWRCISEKGESIDEVSQGSIEKCRQLIDRNASLLVRQKDYNEHIIYIEPCITWLNGDIDEFNKR